MTVLTLKILMSKLYNEGNCVFQGEGKCPQMVPGAI